MKSPVQFFSSTSMFALLLGSFFVLSSYVRLADVPVVHAAGPTINKVTLNGSSFKKYDMVEMTVDLTASYTNPFRASVTPVTYRNDDKTSSGTGLILDGFFTTPAGTTVQVPGFYNVNYVETGKTNLSNLLAVDSAGRWNVRYTPKEPGTYKYYVTSTDQTGTSQSAVGQFTVTSDINPLYPHGGLKVSATNPGYLEYEDGTPYVELGVTNTDPSGKGVGPDNFADLSANGVNFVRTWLTNGSNSSIFRNTLNNWRTNASGHFDSTVYRSGKMSYRVDASALGTTKFIIDQPDIGGKANTCYISSIWAKTSSNFSGTVKLMNLTGTTRNSTASITAPNQDWTQYTVGPYKQSTLKSIDFRLMPTAITSGTIWLDDAALYETVADAAGNCTTTPKYTSNAYSMLWDPGFEADHSNGDPSHFNMPNLARFEQVLNAAAQNHMFVMPCIFDHRVWGNSADSHSNWAPFFLYDIDPATGKAPYEFWTDSNSIEQAKFAVRYLVARFGYSPALGLWELSNEMDPAYDINRVNWMNTIIDYFHQIDINKHLITNSYWSNPGSRIETDVKTDVGQIHQYINDDTRTNKYPEYDEYFWAIDREKWADNSFTVSGKLKPYLSGEFGLMGDRIISKNADGTFNKSTYDLSKWADSRPADANWLDTVTSHDTTGIFYHNAVWAMLNANAFRNSVSNWWSAGDAPFMAWNYKTHYIAPSKFVSYLPFYDDANSKRLSTYSATDATWRPADHTFDAVPILDGGLQVATSNSDIRVLGREKDNKAYLWVQNKNNTWGNRVVTGASITDESGTITIPGFTPNSQLLVKFVSSYSGNLLSKTGVVADPSGKITLNIALTTIEPDVAIAIGGNETAPITITQSAAISDGGTTAHAGDTIKYTIAVKNSSDVIQTTAFTDPLDTTNVNFVSADNNGFFATVNGQPTITWKDLPVNPNATLTLSFSVIVKSVTPPTTTTPLISNITTTSQRTYATSLFSVGKPMFIDKTISIRTMPAALAGTDGIKTAYADRIITNPSFLSFSLSEDSKVYVAYDKRLTSLPSWLSGWEDTGLTITDNQRRPVTYKLYSKTFTAGKVTLGGNSGTSKTFMYFVLVKPITPPPATENLISGIKAASGKAYVAAQSQVGSVAYIDRTYTIKSIDASLPAGSTWIQTANDDKTSTGDSFLTFSLGMDATIYVAFDSRTSTVPAWLAGWTKTAMTVETNDLNGPLPYNLYSKKFTAGTVALGGNGSTSGCMYLVIVDKI